MDLTNKQELFNHISTVKEDSKALWGIVSSISLAMVAAEKTKDALDKVKKELAEEYGEDADGNPCNPLDSTALVTDEQIRARVKRHLLNRLADGTLSASDIGQLKDVFGIANKESDLSISVIDYRSMCLGCPRATPESLTGL